MIGHTILVTRWDFVTLIEHTYASVIPNLDWSAKLIPAIGSISVTKLLDCRRPMELNLLTKTYSKNRYCLLHTHKRKTMSANYCIRLIPSTVLRRRTLGIGLGVGSHQPISYLELIWTVNERLPKMALKSIKNVMWHCCSNELLQIWILVNITMSPRHININAKKIIKSMLNEIYF